MVRATVSTLKSVWERSQSVLRSYILSSTKRNACIVGDGRGADDHAGRVCAIAGDAVRGAGVATKCAEISDGERWLAANMNKSAGENGNDCKTDFSLHVHGRVVFAEELRISEKNFRAQAQI